MKKILPLMTFCIVWLYSNLCAQRRMENLGRGVVAVRSGQQIFVSWRLLGRDPAGIGFNIYRTAGGGTAIKLNAAVLTAGTNFTDNTASLSNSNTYYVRPVINGSEQAASAAFTLPANAPDQPCVVVPLRSGNYVHFAWVGDLDGDGEYDYIVDRLNWTTGGCKIEAYKRDGTFLWEVDYGPNSLNMDNITPGSATIDVGNWDGVTVYDLDGDGKAEVITKIANGVTFGDGNVWTNSSDTRQWLAVLDGATGALKRYAAIPADYLAAGPLNCNLGIGYLDGTTPSIVAKFKNRNSDRSFNMMICAFRYTASGLTQQWKWLRGSDDRPDGHQIRIVDVDGDGRDEICDIGFCLNGDGSLRYSLAGQGIIHGDRTQIGKLDPARPGLQGYAVQQDNPSGLLEYYYDAGTGNVLWKHIGGVADVGRGVAADIDPRYPGYEVWSFSGIYNGPSNTKITDEPNRPWPNFRIWWDGDLLSETFNEGKLEKWNYTSSTVSRLLTTANYQTARGSYRGAPMLYGDIFGDWREEVVMTSSDYSKLVIFTSPVATNSRIYTLAHNPAYRNGMTLKGYMQSHLTDFYLGNGMQTPPVPAITYASNTLPATTVAAIQESKPVTSPSLRIYPNPVHQSFVNVQVKLTTQSLVRMMIEDMSGQRRFMRDLGTAGPGMFSQQVDISSAALEAGTFILRIQAGQETFHTKIIKQ
ncbi:rhamnogalacturonan lyase family protein [Chitinophaga rhizophila]|uniref:T9SS type A sorting domain-containing protein n=1 Tax=Chitinophaga rhizophila TaxID=2866212 RepID=A0ABS7GIH8_9BACT|nr:T9SS type A sorting domain-containing protein [Chitinophaga rhizophila]MBW8687489.1 T9SS type A sorting domain-containing protein [Chitinophaga rhizophila]